MDSPSAQQHHHHHHQEMSSETLESMLVCTKPDQDHKKPRPAEQQPQKCPRCDSANTKFCYYNNYSLSQPRYFCKSCRRYWTKGGTLRNVPVGGGCRKNKRVSSSTKRIQENNNPNNINPIVPIISSYDQHHHHHSTDLSLAFARLQKQASGHHLGIDHQQHDDKNNNNNNNNMSVMYNPDNNTTSFLGFLENAPSGFHQHNNMYYDNIGQVEMGMNYDDIGTTTTTTRESSIMTTLKQECHENNTNNSKILWGFPWQQQMNGDHIGNNMNIMGDFESTNRQNWNGFGASSNWHGLLNSPLM